MDHPPPPTSETASQHASPRRGRGRVGVPVFVINGHAILGLDLRAVIEALRPPERREGDAAPAI